MKHKNWYIGWIACLLLLSCGSANIRKSNRAYYTTMYVLVACKGDNYYTMNEKMQGLSQLVALEVNRMERRFDTSKYRMVNADYSEENAYAGDYFPRQYPSEYLSLEYEQFYKNHSGNEATIFLVAGIYEKKVEAKMKLREIKKIFGSAYIVKDVVYDGCLR